jgi:hypothetical protein
MAAERGLSSPQQRVTTGGFAKTERACVGLGFNIFRKPAFNPSAENGRSEK